MMILVTVFFHAEFDSNNSWFVFFLMISDFPNQGFLRNFEMVLKPNTFRLILIVYFPFFLLTERLYEMSSYEEVCTFYKLSIIENNTYNLVLAEANHF